MCLGAKPWSLTAVLNQTSCTAVVDFSKCAKPAKPPVPLRADVKRTTAGTQIIEWTDPSGTLNPDPTYPLNIWTPTAAEHPGPAAAPCAEFGALQFQDMHDGDVKSMSIADGVLSLGQ